MEMLTSDVSGPSIASSSSDESIWGYLPIARYDDNKPPLCNA